MEITENIKNIIIETTNLAGSLGFEVIRNGYIKVASFDIDITAIEPTAEAIAKTIAQQTKNHE